jgi:hypothetical protein
MKISYRTHPMLERLEKGSLGTLPVSESDQKFFFYTPNQFTPTWKRYCSEFRKEVNVVSQPFIDALEKAQPKLNGLYQDIMGQDLSDFKQSATYIIGTMTFMIYQRILKGEEAMHMCLYIFRNDGMPICYYCNDPETGMHGWVSNTVGSNTLTPEQGNAFAVSHVVNCAAVYIFKHYAQVETKELPAGQKVKGIDCKYVNDTKLNLTYLNSTWFTNLVKSDGFKVRGHFRLQPKKKDGSWTKELIWIDEFQKTGYTAPARKLKEDRP